MSKHKEKELKRRQKIEDRIKKEKTNQKKENIKLIVYSIFGVGVLIIIGFLIFLGLQASQQRTDPAQFGFSDLLINEPSDIDITYGNGPITIIKYSDFRCPACALIAPALEQIKNDFYEDVTFVYRYFPLDQDTSFRAAQAAHAAHMQGAFWEYHDILFANQQQWSSVFNPDSLFESYAQELGLNSTQFRSDFRSNYVRAMINHHAQSANQFGIRATPTLLINGRVFSVTSFETAYDELSQHIINLLNN